MPAVSNEAVLKVEFEQGSLYVGSSSSSRVRVIEKIRLCSAKWSTTPSMKEGRMILKVFSLKQLQVSVVIVLLVLYSSSFSMSSLLEHS